MQITYDTQADAIYIKLSEGRFLRNNEVEEGVILDIGEGNVLLGIEILEASTRYSAEDLSKVDISKVDIRMPLHLAEREG